jgi:LETM1 and EF-hand domain-containing protein 1
MTDRIALVYTDLRTSKSLLSYPTHIVPTMYINNMTYPQIRMFCITPNWRGQEPSSKIEETIKSIKEEKELKEKTECVVNNNEQLKKVVVKPPLWERIKGEILHYYHGFRLLGLDMKVSAKLIWRILHGNELSRREHRLVF